jgi:hypothetical protein
VNRCRDGRGPRLRRAAFAGGAALLLLVAACSSQAPGGSAHGTAAYALGGSASPNASQHRLIHTRKRGTAAGRARRLSPVPRPGALRRGSAQDASLVLDKIASDGARLYDRATGAAFAPRGANFVRLAESSGGAAYHSSFEPGQYSHPAVASALAYMKSSGYNTVRVFIDAGDFTNPSHGISTGVSSNDPLNAAYVANVVDFVRTAGHDGIYTIPVLAGVPANTYYYRTAGSPKGNILGNNVLYLDPRFVRAKELYMTNFASAMHQALGTAGVNDILAYEPDNEVFFEANKPPFSTMSGTLTSLDGLTYDMSQQAQRQQAADANLVQYTDDMKTALAKGDPGALLMMGFFTNQAVAKGGFNGFTTYCSANCNPSVDYRVPGRPAALSIFSKVDIIDMHVYPTSTTWSLRADLATSEYSLFRKPYIIGEFGVMKSVYGNDVVKAAYAMRDLETASCPLGARGWLFFTWDSDQTTSLASLNLFYSVTDDRGAINGVLAPIVRPKVC